MNASHEELVAERDAALAEAQGQRQTAIGLSKAVVELDEKIIAAMESAGCPSHDNNHLSAYIENIKDRLEAAMESIQELLGERDAAQRKLDGHIAEGVELIKLLQASRAEVERLREAAIDLLFVLDVDGPATADEPDDDSVGWNGDGSPMPMTFGHIRRLRTATALTPGAGRC